MANKLPNVINIITPTTAASPAATYSFVTSGYKPPRQPRAITTDEVHNQNGKFKYVYDSGPGFLEWDPFEILCDDKFANVLGGMNGVQQKAQLDALWQFIGTFQLGDPEGVYNVYWTENPYEKRFQHFPAAVGDKIQYRFTIQVQEA